MSDLDQVKERVNLLHYIEQTTKSRATGKTATLHGNIIEWVAPCPMCNEGVKTPHFFTVPDTASYGSFAPCCKGGTIIDYLMEAEGMDKRDAIQKAKDLAGVADDVPTQREKPQQATPRPVDYPQMIQDAALTPTSYYTSRGLTQETVNRFQLGYTEQGPYGKRYPYLMPVTDNHLIFRGVEGAAPKYQKTTGTAAIFNGHYITNPDSAGLQIYITEGMFDALSLEQLGHSAISLNGTAASKLIKAIDGNREAMTAKAFILALDNDGAGQTAAKQIGEALQKLGIKHYSLTLPAQYKDVNEYLIADPAGLARLLSDVSYKGSTHEYLAGDFWRELERSHKQPPLKTGIAALDDVLGGGIYPGLFVLSADPGAGKTAIALQIADHIASEGQPILYFSLEMSRLEMTCRSLARECMKVDKNAPNTGDILKGRLTPNQKALLERVATSYAQTARCITMQEGDFAINTERIRQHIREYMALTGLPPVVVIDYLQILRPLDPRMNEKQAVDYNIVDLKRMSRELGVAVVVVSSKNRAGYSVEDKENGKIQKPSLKDLKESGSIEYTADCVLAMYKKGEIETRRMVGLVVLKNRRGRMNGEADLAYYPAHNLFTE